MRPFLERFNSSGFFVSLTWSIRVKNDPTVKAAMVDIGSVQGLL